MSAAPVHRNDPCPCGSGRKFKSCHGRSSGVMRRPVALPMWGVIVGVIVVGAAAAMGVRLATRPAALPDRLMPAPIGAALPSPGTASVAGSEPAAWSYDPRTNKHWNPDHRHWHDGPAPATATAGRDSAGRTITVSPPRPVSPVATPEPSPWTYDESRKQYWDPRHHHGHNGPQPSLAKRESLMALPPRGATVTPTVTVPVTLPAKSSTAPATSDTAR